MYFKSFFHFFRIATCSIMYNSVDEIDTIKIHANHVDDTENVNYINIPPSLFRMNAK